MLMEIWRDLVGEAPDYFTQGSSYGIQWHYGELLEYAFVGLCALLLIILVMRFIIMFCRTIFDR